MVKITAFLIIYMFLGGPLVASAGENNSTFDQWESKLSSLRNPFKSQLPVKEIKKPVIKEKRPVALKPVKKPDTEIIPSTPNKPEVEPEKKKPIPPLPNITINGIIWDSDRPQAIINGHIIDIGDAILQIEITDIRKTEIEGLFHGRPVTIKTQRSSI